MEGGWMEAASTAWPRRLRRDEKAQGARRVSFAASLGMSLHPSCGSWDIHNPKP